MGHVGGEILPRTVLLQQPSLRSGEFIAFPDTPTRWHINAR